MAYSAITIDGKTFINDVCIREGNNLLSGTHTYPLLYTDPKLIQTWTCEFKHNGINVTNGSMLASALIDWFNKYAEMYQLDANVIAAQAYAESRYRIWEFPQESDSSGISQFKMGTIFDVIVTNKFGQIPMTVDEIDTITNGLDEKTNVNSYLPKQSPHTVSYHNRPILHQNVINNPEIMIKAQCRYMKYIANNCDSLTSTSLFNYNRGPSYMAKTYSDAIKKYQNTNSKDEKGLDEALKYVLKIFGILGDKTNYLNSKLSTKNYNYKTPGYYFGYDDKFEKIDPNKNLKLNQSWNAFNANVDESIKYDITEITGDVIAETLSVDSKYKYITFSSDYYYMEEKFKKQIVLHHTASGEGYVNDVAWWKTIPTSTGYKVSTPFIVTRSGEIIQLFSTKYWSYHLGINENVIKNFGTQGVSNVMLNSQAIGIEIDSWGGLIYDKGNWYPAQTNNPTMPNTNMAPIPIENVSVYPDGYHGFFGFEKYTQNQINALRTIINAIKKVYTAIPLEYVNDLYPNTNMWGTYNETTKSWEPATYALAQKEGIWTHVSFSPTKSDCHPQAELVIMLKTL